MLDTLSVSKQLGAATAAAASSAWPQSAAPHRGGVVWLLMAVVCPAFVVKDSAGHTLLI